MLPSILLGLGAGCGEEQPPSAASAPVMPNVRAATDPAPAAPAPPAREELERSIPRGKWWAPTGGFAAPPSEKRRIDDELTLLFVHREVPLSGDEVERRDVFYRVRENAGAMLDCFEASIGGRPELEVDVRTSFTITPQGKVRGLEVLASNIEDQELERCLLNELRSIEYQSVADGTATEIRQRIGLLQLRTPGRGAATLDRHKK